MRIYIYIFINELRYIYIYIYVYMSSFNIGFKYMKKAKLCRILLSYIFSRLPEQISISLLICNINKVHFKILFEFLQDIVYSNYSATLLILSNTLLHEYLATSLTAKKTNSTGCDPGVIKFT